MDKKEFWRMADDDKAYPFAVTYQDRQNFPPQNFYATKEEAFAQIDRNRVVVCIMERKGGMGRELFGTMWPKK